MVTGVIPNAGNTRYLNPPAELIELGNSLRIGTPVRIEFLDSKFQKMEVVGEAPDIESFTFQVGSLSAIGRQQFNVVKLKLQSASWTFPLENLEEPTEEELKNPVRMIKPSPDEDLLEKTKSFQAGDLVCVDYETKNFMFVMTDIRPATINITGKILAKFKKNKKVGEEIKSLEYVSIRDDKGKVHVLQIDFEDTEAETGLSAVLAKMEKGADVTATATRVSGVYKCETLDDA